MSYSEENMGKAFKKALDGYEIQPPESLWENVNSINLKTGVTKPFAQYSNFVFAVIAVVTLAAVSYFVINKGDMPSGNTAVIQNDTVVASNLKADNTKTKFETSIGTLEDSIEINKNDSSNNKVVKGKLKTSRKINVIANCGDKNVVNIAQAFESVDSMETSYINNDDIEDDINIDKEANASFGENNITIDKSSEMEKTVVEVDSFIVKYSPNPSICFGEDALLIAEDGYQYHWNTGDFTNQIMVSPIGNSTYTVTVTNNLGQRNIHTFNVSVDKECSALFIPSAFTPNGDGRNDVFRAEGVGITNLKLVVYSKLGQILFETNNIDQAWDGRYKGELQAATIYFYQASYIDAKGENHIKRGQITLIR